MFEWLKKKKQVDLPKELIFKNTEAAFEYAAMYLAGSLTLSNHLYGLVVGLAAEKGTVFERRLRLSNPLYRVKLATNVGIVEVENCGSITKDFSGRDPAAGDLVAVNVAQYNPKYAASDMMNYFLAEFIVLPRIQTNRHQFIPLVDEEGIEQRLAAERTRPRPAGTQGQSVEAAREPRRLHPCPCGSGKRFKDCHGALPHTKADR